MSKKVQQKKTTSTKSRAKTATTSGKGEEIASEMRRILGWVAHNIEASAKGDVRSYEVNALRSQVLELLALANDVDCLVARAEVAS